MLEERPHKRGKTSDDTSSSVAGSTSADTPAIESYCEVFLSSGADTVNGFTGCLLTYFVDVGRVYALNGINDIQIGKDTGFKLRKAINHSRILIPILSRGYLSDKGCLNELTEMVRSMRTTGQIVRPIFYDFEPGFLKHQKKSFNKAFLQHSKDVDKETVQIWKQTLKDVAELKGWELKKDAHRDEGKLVKQIVSDVSKELKSQNLALKLNVTNNLVGLDHHVKEMTRLLDVSKMDVRIVGICGASGIGKTTIARALYNQVSKLFEYCIFLEDIRNEHEGLDHLQTELLFNFLKQERQDTNDVGGGINFLKCKFKNRKILIVLDDVDQRSQVNAVAGNCHWFGAGSRIIVTTRKKYVLPTDEVAWIYEPNEPDSNESLQLFSKQAFQRNHPPRDYYDRSIAMASILAGNPLTLKIVGSFLFGKSKEVWDDTMQKLSQSLNTEVEEKLKSNYDALDYEQRQIFLDIACLFSGVDKRIAHYMWDDCDFYPENGIEFLRALSLLNIGDDNLLRMDVQMRDLGRKVCPKGKSPMRPTRLWPEKPLDNKVTQEAEAPCAGRKKFHFPNEPSKLRYLNLDNVNLDDEFEDFFPKLRWLCWLRWNYCPPKLSWTRFHVQNLVILDLSWSQISDDWEGWNHIKVARKLKVLNLTGCSCLTTTLIFSDSLFPYLERLIVEDCEELTDIHPSISYLKSLVYLSFKNCAKLNELPPNLGLNEALQEIVLDGTSVQSILPIPTMKNLQKLLASHCRLLDQISFTRNLESLLDVAFDFAGIIKLPDSIGLLVKLQSLSLSHCSSLKELPDSIGKLKALVELNLVAAGVTNLPEDIRLLNHLRVLNLTSSSIRVLPTSLGMLKKLEHLNVSYCTDFEGDLPSSIGELYCLRILNLSGTQINNLPTSIGELSSLQILDLGWDNQISGRTGITELPDSIGLLVDLQYLSLTSLKKIPKFIWSLESLVELDLEKMGNVQLPETIAHLRNLRKLNMKDCERVQFPVQLKLPCALTSLTLPCTASSLESIESLRNLRRLCLFSSVGSELLEDQKSISNSSKLEELTLKGLNVNSLPSLLELRFENCLLMKSLALSNLEKLEHLSIENCEDVNEIEGIDKLESLRVLRVMGCMSLKVLPDLSKCRMLLELNLRKCEKLRDIKGLESLASLEELDISFCKSLKSLPNVSNLLKVVKKEGLEALTSSEKSTMSEASSSFPIKTVIAAASSSRPAEYDHEVFLSFRGEDTVRTFVDHLYCYLRDVRIGTFRDSEALHVGEQLSPEILAVIEQSKIMIPILSKNYASSKWCLMELTHMVKCMKTTQQIILPVFYDVTPADVYHQAGAFAEAFLQYEKEFEKKITQEWKEALKQVAQAQLKGCENDRIANGYEAELIKKVVTKVLIELKKKHVEVTEHLVGMDQHEAELMQLLDLDCNDVKIVGIVGMGGIGKTTIAKGVYNKLCDQFHQRCSLLLDVREKVKQSGGLDDLKKQLMSDILRRTSDIMQMNQSTFKSTKALIVLDDVADRSQLEKIIGGCDWFGPGSRIIVTTRNRDTLIEQKGEKIFEPIVMDPDNALHLFCKHAFRQYCPREGYEEISMTVVSRVEGLPLSLEVIGSLLYTKKRKVWNDILKKLEKMMPGKIREMLQISFDMLDDGQKEIFLDIACHFNHSWKEIGRAASYMWEDCGFFPVSGIEVLITLSLVKIDENGYFEMHDQLRDLGREIVRQQNPHNPGGRSRLWSREVALDVLTSKTGTDRVETLTLGKFEEGAWSYLSDEGLSNEEFKGLSRLRYLDLSYYSNLKGDFEGLLSNLRWFCWHPRSQIRGITYFCLPKLVVLDLSNSKIFWEDWIQIKKATNLKLLDLSCCYNLTKTPDLFAFSKLERLNLKGCSNLVEISPSIGHLQHLNYLNLNHCYKCCEVLLGGNTKLSEFVWNLKSLAELHMKCLKVTELSEAIGNLTNLRILDVEGTSIKKFPNTIGMLEKLEKLDASRCTSLGGVPETIGNLRNLRVLKVNSSGIKKLPAHVGMLGKLEELDASGCKSLGGVPETIGNLRNLRVLKVSSSGVKKLLADVGMLEELDASGCESLGGVPETIGKLRNLRVLKVNSSEIKKLPADVGMLEKLEELDASGCKSLGGLPETIGNLRNLRFLKVNSSGIKKLPADIGMLQKLEELDASGCESLGGVPETIGNLRNLRVLKVNSSGIKKLPADVGMLEKLEELDVSGCKSLGGVPETIGNLKNLRVLKVNSSGIKKLPADVGMLEELDASGCESLGGVLETVGNLRNLRVLKVNSCGIKKLPAEIGMLLKLEELDASGCKSLGGVPETIGNLRNLRVLKVNSSGIRKLHAHVGMLENLEELDASGCKSLGRVPKTIGNLRNLRVLKVNSSGITKLHAHVGMLQNLEELDASGCKSLGRVPKTIGNLRNLRVLKVNSSGIKKLPADVGMLEKLEELDASGCKSLGGVPETIGNLWNLRFLKLNSSGIKKLPADVGMLEKLEELDASGCKSLGGVPETIGNLWNLRFLKLNSSGIKKLPADVGMLEKLEVLDCGWSSLEGELPSGVWSISALRVLCLNNTRISSLVPADISACGHLTILNLGSCPNIRLPSSELKLPTGLERLEIPLTKASLDSVARLPKLERLIFHWCGGTDLVEFPIDLGGLTHELDELKFHGFENFTSLPVKINNLTWLRVLSFGDYAYFDVDEVGPLKLGDCKFLERLPDLPNALEEIRIRNCPKLFDVDSLAGLTSLGKLDIRYCPSLRSLPDLSTLQRLKVLSIFRCENLSKIRGVEAQTCLQRLSLRDCPSLEKLPDLSHLEPQLLYLEVENCGQKTSRHRWKFKVPILY